MSVTVLFTLPIEATKLLLLRDRVLRHPPTFNDVRLPVGTDGTHPETDPSVVLILRKNLCLFSHGPRLPNRKLGMHSKLFCITRAILDDLPIVVNAVVRPYDVRAVCQKS